MKNKIISAALFMLFAATTFGQYFSTPVESFSRKKPAYITLKSGEEVTGTIKDYDLKRGLIDEITIEVAKKDKRKYTPDQISHMYLPQSGFDKMSAAYAKMYDATMWESDDVNAEYMKDGYAYFEQSVVQLKRKEINALLQMVNASFNKPVKVFHDPWASESASLNVKGIKVAGGIEKSYWVVVGDDVAFKIEKKNYNDKLGEVYKNCSDYISKLGDKPAWKDFPEALHTYSKDCK